MADHQFYPDKAFHVTTQANLASILLNGLAPLYGRRSQQFGETMPKISFFVSREGLEEAMTRYFEKAFGQEEELVILEVASNVIVHPNPDHAEAFAVEKIPPSAIIAIYDRNWQFVAKA